MTYTFFTDQLTVKNAKIVAQVIVYVLNRITPRPNGEKGKGLNASIVLSN